MTEPQPPYGPPAGYGTSGVSGYGPQPSAAPGWPSAAGSPVPTPYGPGSGYQQETSSKAIVALVLAIGSFVVLPFVTAIAGLVLASSARREIDESGGRLTGEGLATAAKVLSWINIALCVAAVLLFVVVLGLFAVGSSSTS